MSNRHLARLRQPKVLALAISAVVNGGLLGTLAVSSMWRLDKLPVAADHGTLGIMAAAAPAGAPASSGVARTTRRIVREPVQPVPRSATTPDPASTALSIARIGEGDGPGGGDGGNGEGESGGEGEPCLVAGGCITPPSLPPVPTFEPPAIEIPPLETKVIAPTVLSALRIAGDVNVQPDGADLTAMQRAGSARVTGNFRVCIDTAGRVDRVATVRSTGYAGYDARLLSTMRAWRYRPYAVDGGAVAACSMVTFVFAPTR